MKILKKILIFTIILLVCLESLLHLFAFLTSKGILFKHESVKASVFEDKTLKIMCVGDSCTYGVGAGYQKSYPVQLYRFLIENNIDCKVFNRGIPGANSSQTVSTLNDFILQDKPDIIFVLFGMNDEWNILHTGHLELLKYMKNDFSLFLRYILSYSRLYKLIMGYRLRHIASLRHKQMTGIGTIGKYPGNKEVVSYMDEIVSLSHDTSFFYELLSENSKAIIDIANKFGAKVVFLGYHIDEDDYIKRKLMYNPKIKIEYVDNKQFFLNYTKKGVNLLSNDKFHFNELGYIFMAANIFNFMIDKSIISAEKIDFDDLLK